MAAPPQPAAPGNLPQPSSSTPSGPAAAAAADAASIPGQTGVASVEVNGRPRRDVSETSDLSSLDGEPGAAAGGLPPVASASAAADAVLPLDLEAASATGASSEGAPTPAGKANDIQSANVRKPDVVVDDPTPSATASSAVSATTSVTATSPRPPPPPAPRSLSSALSSPGSPAASNSSDPTAETEPLAGSPRDDEDDDDEPAVDAEDDGNDDDEMDGSGLERVVVDSPAARRRRRQQQRSARKPLATAVRAPSAPPAVKAATVATPTLAIRAATASPKTAIEKAKEAGGSGVAVGQANLWKADEEGDSDLTPDEESDADEQSVAATRPSKTGASIADDDNDDDEDDDDRMDVDPSPSKTRNGAKVTTPRASTQASTPTASRPAVAETDDDEDEDESESQPTRPKRSARTQQRASRQVLASEDEDEDEADEADSESSDDEADGGEDGQQTPKKTSTAVAPAVGPSPANALKSAPRMVNGELPRAKSPVVPQSEELSPPPTSPGQSNADEDEDDDDEDDEAAEDEAEAGKTPTKSAKPDVRFNLMTGGAGTGAGEPFQEDEEMEDDDDDDDEAVTAAEPNGDLPELRIDEVPTETVAAVETEAETAQAEADEVALPDTPQLSGGESTFPIALNLQAQQRLDAMEALSKIEIAFARLRDLMHLERMEECAREEEKLLNDTHPLLMQVQTRLTALRDRELSSIEARHVVATAESTLVEKADVSGIWEWWRNGREELQRDMMADVMRKRRRVDREKRAVEGGRPKRPLPVAPPGPPRALSRKEPALEDLLPSSYLNYRPEEKRKMREEREAWGPRPGLLGLDERGRDNDLDLLGIGPSTRYHQHQAQMFRPFDGHGQPMMGGPPMHHPHHVMQNQPPQPYHTLQPHAYAPPPPPPPHPADGVYLQQNRPPYPYRPPIMAPFQADGHLQNGPHPPQMGLHPHHAGHPPHQGPPGPPHHVGGNGGLQPAFGEAYGKPPGSSVVIGRPPPGSGGHHATGRAIMPSSSLPPNGVGPSGPEVGHASYASFDMAFGGGSGAGNGALPGGQPYGHAHNGPPGPVDNASPHKRARTGSPVGFRTLGIV